MIDRDESQSVSVRKIDNGWLETRSRSDGSRYESSERFHAERPDLSAPASEPKAPPSALKAAITALNGKR